jgi:hypothetical protein
LYFGDHPQRDDINETFHIINSHSLFQNRVGKSLNDSLQQAVINDDDVPFFNEEDFTTLVAGLVKYSDEEIKTPFIVDHIKAFDSLNSVIDQSRKTLDTYLNMTRLLQSNPALEPDATLASRLLRGIAQSLSKEFGDNDKKEIIGEAAKYLCPKVSPEAIREVYEGIPKGVLLVADNNSSREFISEVKSYIPRYDPKKIESNEEKKPLFNPEVEEILRKANKRLQQRD